MKKAKLTWNPFLMLVSELTPACSLESLPALTPGSTLSDDSYCKDYPLIPVWSLALTLMLTLDIVLMGSFMI